MRLTGPARNAIAVIGFFCSAFAAAQEVRFNEIHYDNLGTDTGEAIEVVGPAGFDLNGYSIVLYNGATGGFYGTRILSGTLPASCGATGVVAITYPTDGIQNGSPDGMALVRGSTVVEFLSYEGTFTAATGPAATRISVDIGVAEASSTPIGRSLQRTLSGAWREHDSSFGACNEEPAEPNHVTISGRGTSDVPLPVGFQDQLFAQLVNSSGNLPSNFIWTSETPATASIDANGVFTALAEGSATLRATADDGTTATITLPTRVATASSTAQYGNHAEFGEPADADASDDYIVRHPQYIASYNSNRGTPNWVTYNLEATHFGSEDRCDCFTMDPSLPASFPQLTTADYTGSGAFHGYGIDRGHLARSFDRTSGSLDNANTYLFDNIVPQAADLNQGPWAAFETFLGDEALNDREVYIVTGVAGSQGTLKNEGRVVIPASTWKVAVIMPRDRGLSNVVDYRDLEVIAVNMPNTAGVRNEDWNTYLTTVDDIEALTGYDLLALLPDDVETVVENNTQPPFANIAGTASLDEGGSASFSGAASVDPNGSIVSYAWQFGDGASGEGESTTHTYAQDGTYTVVLTVTDNDGLTASATHTVTVANVAPVIAAIPNATLDEGGAHTVSGTFTDPGTDAWTATVNFGDGSAPEQAMLSSRSFSLVHVYPNAGTYTVTVTIADDDSSASTTHTVTVNEVQQPEYSIAPLKAELRRLVATGKMPRIYGILLNAQLETAQRLLDQGKYRQVKTVLDVVYKELDLLVRCRVVTKQSVAPMKQMIWDLIHALPR